MRTTRIVIFAKAPQAGAVKTRLIPALGASGAAELARRMLTTTIESAIGAELGPVELCMTPGPGAAGWSGIEFPERMEMSDQGIGDLGARLARAAQRTLERGESVMLIGTDCIEMSAALLRAAAVALDEVGAVIHCTADGGYAVLGLTRFDARLFVDIPWSTAAVAAETLRRIQQLKWPAQIGQTLHDLDEPQDLERMPPAWRQPFAGAPTISLALPPRSR